MAIVLAGLALWQRGLAQDEARRGGVYGLAGASEAALDEDPELAMLLALKSAEVSDNAGDPVTPATLTALQGAVQNSRLESVIEGGLFGVAVSSDGSLGHARRCRESAGGHRLGSGHRRRAENARRPTRRPRVEFSPPALSCGGTSPELREEGSITVWDAATGEEVDGCLEGTTGLCRTGSPRDSPHRRRPCGRRRPAGHCVAVPVDGPGQFVPSTRQQHLGALPRPRHVGGGPTR